MVQYCLSNLTQFDEININNRIEISVTILKCMVSQSLDNLRNNQFQQENFIGSLLNKNVIAVGLYFKLHARYDKCSIND